MFIPIKILQSFFFHEVRPDLFREWIKKKSIQSLRNILERIVSMYLLTKIFVPVRYVLENKTKNFGGDPICQSNWAMKIILTSYGSSETTFLDS